MHAILPTPEVSCAPELLQRKEVTGKADIYSVGWLLWHILTQQPWPAPGQPQPALDSLHPSYQALIQACWQEDPSQRPDAKSLLKGCQAIALLTPEAQEQLFTQGQALEAQSDYPGAKAAFAQAASQGHAKAAYSLGMLYANRKIPLAPQAMLRALTQAADANYYRAQYNLARVYEKGELIEKDPKKAIALYQKAANNPNTPDDMRTFAQGKIQSLQTSSGLDMAETNTSAARPGFN
jgi:tetratricopeptide (TPR) repeat protein